MSSKGTATFVAQRRSAMILAPLVLWFLFSAVMHAGDSYEELQVWLGAWPTKVLLGGLVTAGAFHMRIGMGEIIEDYIHGALKSPLMMANWAAAILVALATWAALLSISA